MRKVVKKMINSQDVNDEYRKIRNVEDYYINFIKKLIRKTNAMKTTQITRALTIRYGIKKANAERLLVLAQKKNCLAISMDGYALSIPYYKMITEDIFLDQMNLSDYEQHIAFPIYAMIEKHEKDIIKCLDVVIEMLPYSEDFIITPSPFNITFDVPFIENEKENIKSSVYQITLFDKENFITKAAMVTAVGKIEDTDMRKVINRIAIVETTDNLNLIPYMGYTKVVLNDGHHIKIIERRQNPWQ